MCTVHIQLLRLLFAVSHISSFTVLVVAVNRFIAFSSFFYCITIDMYYFAAFVYYVSVSIESLACLSHHLVLFSLLDNRFSYCEYFVLSDLITRFIIESYLSPLKFNVHHYYCCFFSSFVFCSLFASKFSS